MDFTEKFSDIYTTFDDYGRTGITPYLTLDGDGIKFYFYLQSDKYMRIETDDTFEAWFEQITYTEREKYWKYVEKINERFATSWDEKTKGNISYSDETR